MDTIIPDGLRSEAGAKRRIRAVKIAVAASLLAGSLELTLGLLLGLASITAEGVHTLLDGVDSIIILLAVYLAARPADRCHQFGHGKFEALGATVEGSFVFAAAIGIAYQAIQRLGRGEVPDDIPLYACVVMGVTAIFYLLVSTYLAREATRTHSPAVRAEALHLRSHIYITAGVGGGLLLGRIGHWPMADLVLALAVAACLVGISIRIFREVLGQFTDAALPARDIQDLGRIVDRFNSRFTEVHGLRTRQSGAERHIEMHLVIDPDTTVATAHALSHEIEAAIADQWPGARTTVHIEPTGPNRRDDLSSDRDEPKVRTDESSPDEREFIH